MKSRVEVVEARQEKMVGKPKRPRVTEADHINAGQKRFDEVTNLEAHASMLAQHMIDQTVKPKTLKGYVRKRDAFVRFVRAMRDDPKVTRFTETDWILFVDAADNDFGLCAKTIAGYLCAMKFFHKREHFGLVTFEARWSESERVALMMKGLAYKAGERATKGSRGAVNEAMLNELIALIATMPEYGFLINPLRVLHYTGVRRKEFEMMQKGDVHEYEDGTFELYVRCDKRCNKDNPGHDFYYKPLSLKAVTHIRKAELRAEHGEKLFTIKTAPRKKIQFVFELGSKELPWCQDLWFDGYSCRHGFALELGSKIKKMVKSALIDTLAQQVLTTFLGYSMPNEARK
jgi:hypothetical protein